MKHNVSMNTLEVNINFLDLVHELHKDISHLGSTSLEAGHFRPEISWDELLDYYLCGVNLGRISGFPIHLV
ncbi:hypothetical protein SCLCIDRAFT_33723 [Scleroderma citrinum Foug A]|uniref:Uncharacterized protein n=1 Tax=Scleroderma citrinum Foug A TaxID=1036808 RepID=A0A0C2YN21_9AGAM|nr:hypothetical protein SCLCIDRAFT_33723 [Scleroderma citrinum Foug A]